MGASGIGCLGGDSGGMQSRHVGDKESHHQQKLASHYGSDLWATETTGPHASKQVDPQGRRNITLSLSSQVANPLWLPLPGHAVHVAALALHASGAARDERHVPRFWARFDSPHERRALGRGLDLGGGLEEVARLHVVVDPLGLIVDEERAFLGPVVRPVGGSVRLVHLDRSGQVGADPAESSVALDYVLRALDVPYILEGPRASVGVFEGNFHTKLGHQSLCRRAIVALGVRQEPNVVPAADASRLGGRARALRFAGASPLKQFLVELKGWGDDVPFASPIEKQLVIDKIPVPGTQVGAPLRNVTGKRHR
eukprot:CAMPEP_0172653210 /NCGR_PEP_ID=MMETSP1068-20121228/243712_1 /TAXON_ID=35684 /ORGANISM="Pseudopedinella elastica, Strain CCMP716" /LENGTH=310 /DNA_ID=CAMNT_0013467639 /DNA_START=126 /DNA_END=1057 /DNA_ORIENTATION=+